MPGIADPLSFLIKLHALDFYWFLSTLPQVIEQVSGFKPGHRLLLQFFTDTSIEAVSGYLVELSGCGWLA